MARKSRNRTEEANQHERQAVSLAGLYGRLSVEDGDDKEQNSIGNQIKIGKYFVADHAGITLVDTYTDNGYTGMNYNRPAFMRMLCDLQSGRINCVLIKDISRLGRNFVLTGEFVEKTFPRMNVRLISINDEYDSLDENADTAALTLPLKMVMNDYYVKDTSRKIRSSINTKMQNGEFLPAVGSIPYGYLRNPAKNTYDIDSETAPTVRKIFELRASGGKYNAIARELNRDGIPSPGKLRYLRGLTKDARFASAEWVRGTVRKITCDPVYTGYRVHGKVKRDKVGCAKKYRKRDEWVLIDNAHPAIVSRELFDAVQKANENESQTMNTHRKRAAIDCDYRDVFRGKLICGDCGSMMVGGKGCARPDAKTPSRVFFDCNGYKYSNRIKCSSHYIRQEDIVDAVARLLEQQVSICADIQGILHDINRKVNEGGQSGVRRELSGIAVQKRNTEAKAERLLVDLTSGLISRDEYEYMKHRFTQQLQKLSAQERNAKDRIAGMDSTLKSVQSWLYAVESYRKTPKLDRALVELLIDRIEVFSDRSLRVVLNYADPYAPLVQYLSDMEAIQHVG